MENAALADLDEGLDEGHSWRMGEDGVFQVWEKSKVEGGEEKQVGKMPGLREYFMDLDYSAFLLSLSLPFDFCADRPLLRFRPRHSPGCVRRRTGQEFRLSPTQVPPEQV